MTQKTPLPSSWIKTDALNRLWRALYVAVVVQVLAVVIPQFMEMLQGGVIDWDKLAVSSYTVGGQALGAYILRYLDKTKIPTPQPPTDVVLAEVVTPINVPTSVAPTFDPTPSATKLPPQLP